MSAVTLPSLVSLYAGSGLVSQRLISAVLTIAVFSTNLIFFLLNRLQRSDSYHRVLAFSLLAFDTLFITFFIYTKGGIESRSEILYVLPILMAATLFGRLGVYLTAAASAAGCDFVLAGNYYNFFHSLDAHTSEAHNGTYVINSIVFFTAVLLIIAALADYVTRLLVAKEQQASAAAATLRRAQAIAKVGSWEWDVIGDSVTWSDELYRLFGVRPGTYIDYGSYLQMVHPEDRTWVADGIEQAISSKHDFSFDHRVLLSNNLVRIFHADGRVTTDRRGKVTHLYGTAHDITAERELEAAKGDFVSLASHQLRTPASSVRMMLALLRDGYVGKLTPKQQGSVVQAFDANERLLKIADDLLNVAKLESGRIILNKAPVDLTVWLKNVVHPYELLAKEKRQRLVLSLPKKPITVDIDAERLAMTVDNLLSNAFKYTPVKGIITITLKGTIRNCNIEVKDTGAGMTRGEINQLFGKFSRLNNESSKGVEGSGLGLFMAKSIAELHGGTIRVQSKPGNGSSFTITLPIKK